MMIQMRQMIKDTKIRHVTDNTTGNRILQYVDLTAPKVAAGKKRARARVEW